MDTEAVNCRLFFQCSVTAASIQMLLASTYAMIPNDHGIRLIARSLFLHASPSNNTPCASSFSNIFESAASNEGSSYAKYDIQADGIFN